MPHIRVFALSLLAVACLSPPSYATSGPPDRLSVTGSVNRSLYYSFPKDHAAPGEFGETTAQHPLGAVTASQSPGTVIGHTWFDYQHSGSMGRMVATGTHPGDIDTFLVHFSWMYLPVPEITYEQREYRYQVFNATVGGFGTETGLQPEEDYAGYVGIDVSGSNHAIVGGHNKQDWPNDLSQSHFYRDFGPGNSFFNVNSRVPDSLTDYGGVTPAGDGAIWPKFRFVEGPDDTVLHVIALENEEPDWNLQALFYFRGVCIQHFSVSWQYPPFVLDTVLPVAHDIAANKDGKVALVWLANLPCPGDLCDTCSAGTDCADLTVYDHDLYYQVSTDNGADWLPRVNLTRNVRDEPGYRPLTDLSALITADNNLHIAWGARLWPIPVDGALRGRIFHWSEDVPYFRTVHNFEWDQTTCNGGAWNLNAAKMSLSECDGKLYCLLVQFNDPGIMMDDCAAPGNPGFPHGAANGDLYLTISDDYGLTWDKARNLTNSHTPGCDSLGGPGGPCDNDHWPSMVRFGSDYTGDFGLGEVVVPGGSVDPETYYLDVQYINDHSAGGIVHDEGFWQRADVKWFRVPCVPPLEIVPPPIVVYPRRIDWPAFTTPGVQLDTPLILENNAGRDVPYTVTLEEETGPTGWLDTSDFDGVIHFGLNNHDTGILILNKDGMVSDPGTAVHLAGRLIFQFVWDPPIPPDTFLIDFWVTPGVPPTAWDTIGTSCTRLVVRNDGNSGNQGDRRVNLDYVDAGDCDSTADIYLYDGSPVVAYVKGGDTIANFAMFGESYLTDNGFIPLAALAPPSDSGGSQVLKTGCFVTHDSLIALEKTWYAPTGHTDTCSFVIQRIMMYLNSDYVGDTTVTGVRVGEAVDWDIPSDSFARNSSGFNAPLNLIYQRGVEYDGLGCQANSNRFGGIRYLDCYHNGVRCVDYKDSDPFGVYTHDNSTHVYPASSFVPETLYTYMGYSGYALSDSAAADLYTMMTFDTGLVLTPLDTFVYYLGLITLQNGEQEDFLNEVRGAGKWYCDHLAPETCSCCTLRGDLDGDGRVDVGDLTYKVAYLFLGGPPPVCLAHGDDDDNGNVDVADLVYEIAYLFLGGPPPPPCP